MTTPEQCLSILEDTTLLLQKAQINLKKCPKQRLTKGYIETRIKAIEDYWTTFRTTHQELIKCTPKEKRAEVPYIVNEDYYIVEDLYSCMLADLRDLLYTFTSSNVPRGKSTNEGQVKLPRIELPAFSGVYEEWPAFKDLFISLVHNNTSISKVQKLHYLKTVVKGEAEALLKHIQVTEANYDQAWDTLSTRYGSKRLIVNSLLKKMILQNKLPFETANHIKSLLDTTNECLNSLKNMNIAVDSWDPIIIFLLVQKLDSESHKEWEEFAYRECSEELPKFDDLQSKYRTLELITPPSREKSNPKNKEHTVHASTTENITDKSCPVCNENHTLYQCRDFKNKNPTERWEYVKNQNLCFNCLATGHSATKCRSSTSCHTCRKRHHTLIHTQKPPSLEQAQAHHSHIDEPLQAIEDKPKDTDFELLSHFTSSKSTALLATAFVPVRDMSGRTTVLRALVDPGSQATFITERATQMLKLRRRPINGTISGVGSTKTSVKHATEIELLSTHDDTFNLKVKAYVMPTRITTQLLSQTIHSSTWPHLERLTLADPSFNQPGRVDLLLGVEVCAQIMKGEIIKGHQVLHVHKTPTWAGFCLGTYKKRHKKTMLL